MYVHSFYVKWYLYLSGKSQGIYKKQIIEKKRNIILLYIMYKKKMYELKTKIIILVWTILCGS